MAAGETHTHTHAESPLQSISPPPRDHPLWLPLFTPISLRYIQTLAARPLPQTRAECASASLGNAQNKQRWTHGFTSGACKTLHGRGCLLSLSKTGREYTLNRFRVLSGFIYLTAPTFFSLPPRIVFTNRVPNSTQTYLVTHLAPVFVWIRIYLTWMRFPHARFNPEYLGTLCACGVGGVCI